MNVLTRLFKRMRFRKTIKTDESINVVDGIVKARILYKKLSLQAHPDKNINRRDEAEDIMQRLTANRHNYAALVEIEKEIQEKLR